MPPTFEFRYQVLATAFKMRRFEPMQAALGVPMVVVAGHLSKYIPGRMLVNFGVQMATGESKIEWSAIHISSSDYADNLSVCPCSSLT